MLDIEREIANDSVGGLKLGSDFSALDNTRFTLIQKEGIWRPTYTYQSITCPLRICVKQNKIISIDVLNGYKGYLNGKYRVGDSLKNLLSDSEWYFVDMLEGFISLNFNKVLIYTSLEDPDFEELNEKVSIDYIHIVQKPCWDSNILLKNGRTVAPPRSNLGQT